MPTPDEVDEILFDKDEIQFDKAAADSVARERRPGSLEFAQPPEAASRHRLDEVEETLFGDDDPHGGGVPAAPIVAWHPATPSHARPPRAVRVDAVDAALFDRTAPTPASKPVAEPDLRGPLLEEPTEPEILPTILYEDEPLYEDKDELLYEDKDELLYEDEDELLYEDEPLVEDEPALIASEGSGEDGESRSTGNKRGRRRALRAAVLLALAAVIGATVIALNRSDNPRPAVQTDSDATTTTATSTTTTSTTTPAATTPPPVPETSAPAVSPLPAPPPLSQRPAPTTASRSANAPAPASTRPPPAATAPAPPPPQPPPPPDPPPPPPPPTPPPTTTSPPPSTPLLPL